MQWGAKALEDHLPLLPGTSLDLFISAPQQSPAPQPSSVPNFADVSHPALLWQTPLPKLLESALHWGLKSNSGLLFIKPKSHFKDLQGG